MALSDPQNVTLDSESVPLVRTGLTLEEGRFANTTGEVILTVRHGVQGARTRHIVKLQKQTIVSDPLVPSTNRPVAYSAHLVMDTPKQGVTVDELVEVAKALVAWATASRLGQVAVGES